MRERNNRDIKKNQGVALVSVLIVIALIGILAASILRVSYLAYARKLVEKRNTDNFYSAEAVIDTVKSIIQNTAATAVSESENGTEAFANAAYEAITGQAYSTTLTQSQKDAIAAALETHIYNNIISTMTTDSTGTSVSDAIKPISEGGNGGSFSIDGEITVETDKVRISDVHVVYVNDEGYTAEITTDIVINAPVYASDITVPVGTYSMFAGNGAIVSATGVSNTGNINNNGYIQYSTASYIHQDGNVYSGSLLDRYGNETKNALIVGAVSGTGVNGTRYYEPATENSTTGLVVMSLGGTNMVFNGNIVVANGNTLIFTGGDGSETANIQVNGYIILRDNSTLLLANNCNLVCKGIVTDIEYNSDGSVRSITPYTGNEQIETVSQFYPMRESKIITNDGDEISNLYNSFNSGNADVMDLIMDVQMESLNKWNGTDNGQRYADDRFWQIALASEGKATTNIGAGVYILETEKDSSTGKWNNRAGDTYKLVKCSYNAVTDVWNWSCSSTYYNNNIICNQTDTKLDQKDKINYKGTLYDAEFAEILNIHLFDLLDVGQYVNDIKYYSNYSIEDDTKYTSTLTWADLITSSDYPGLDRNWGGWVWNSSTNSNEYQTFFDWDYILANEGDRKIIVPKDLTLNNYTFRTITASGITYSTSKSSIAIGGTNEVVSVTNGTPLYALIIRKGQLDIHTTQGYFAGLYMSTDVVLYSQSTGASRGMSLIEFAKHTIADQGINNPNNDVREFIVDVGSSLVIEKSRSKFSSFDDKYEIFVLADNYFNGGVSVFWDRSSTVTSTETNTAGDNSTTNFVDTENWTRH